MSLESRSFLHMVNDQVRKRQNQSPKDATKDSEKHSVILGMFMSSTLQASVFMWKNYSDNLHSIKNTKDLTSCTLQASVFMWKNYSDNLHSIKNTKDLTMKQTFDISEKLIFEQSDEIYGVNTINWEDSSWKYLSFVS